MSTRRQDSNKAAAFLTKTQIEELNRNGLVFYNAVLIKDRMTGEIVHVEYDGSKPNYGYALCDDEYIEFFSYDDPEDMQRC